MAEKKRAPHNVTPPDIREKAVAELRRRQKTGEPIAGLSEMFGISEPTIYAWARGPDRPVLKHGQRISAETKAAAIAEMGDRRVTGAQLQALATKYKTTAKSLRQWRLRAAQRRVRGQDSAPAEKAPDTRERKHRTADFKQRVVDAFVTREHGVEAKHIAARFDVTEAQVYAWNRATRAGALAPLSRDTGAQLTMAELHQPISGHQLDVSISAGPANGLGLLQLRNMQLEAENKRFRKIISLLMEPA